MKQKDILLWTIAIAALLLSVLAAFGSRINGLQTFAKMNQPVAMQGQFNTPINSTPIYNGGAVTAMQGSASCLSWRDQARTSMYELNVDVENQTYPDFDIDEMPQVCMDAVFCNDLDQAAARQGDLGNTEDQQGLDELYNLYCKGQGGTGPGGDGALNSCSDRRAGESDLDCVLRNLTD